MATPTTGKTNGRVVSALHTRSNFGKLLDRVEVEQQSLVIEKHGTPRAVLVSIRHYVKLAAPEPEILRIPGEESQRNGTSTLTSRQIDQVIRAARANRKKQGNTFAPPDHREHTLTVSAGL